MLSVRSPITPISIISILHLKIKALSAQHSSSSYNPTYRGSLSALHTYIYITNTDPTLALSFFAQSILSHSTAQSMPCHASPAPINQLPFRHAIALLRQKNIVNVFNSQSISSSFLYLPTMCRSVTFLKPTSMSKSKSGLAASAAHSMRYHSEQLNQSSTNGCW